MDPFDRHLPDDDETEAEGASVSSGTAIGTRTVLGVAEGTSESEDGR